jgi:hexokinase
MERRKMLAAAVGGGALRLCVVKVKNAMHDFFEFEFSNFSFLGVKNRLLSFARYY